MAGLLSPPPPPPLESLDAGKAVRGLPALGIDAADLGGARCTLRSRITALGGLILGIAATGLGDDRRGCGIERQ